MSLGFDDVEADTFRAEVRAIYSMDGDGFRELLKLDLEGLGAGTIDKGGGRTGIDKGGLLRDARAGGR